MHVVETYFECGGFDHRFIQGGTSVYLWNLARSIAEQGHQVSIVTPAHGRLDDLREIGAVEIDYLDSYRLPLTLDRRTWPTFPAQVQVPLVTRAWHLSLAGVDLYFLSNELLDSLPDRFYPPYESKGTDLVFFKGVAYQVDCVRFIRNHLLRDRNTVDDGAAGAEPLLVHAHEPYYHYLMPAAFRSDARVRVVGTVQSNMPITKSEYTPMVRGLLDFLEAPVDLPAADPAPATELVPMIQYQQRTHLHYAYPPDHVRLYDLVALFADRVSFLSPGHLRFYETFADTPFEQLFHRLPVADTVRRTAGERFVGGCAIGDAWLTDDGPPVDRTAVLVALGLDPALPTFFHNARYAVNHKGQVELMRAIGRVLDAGTAANFVLRMLSDSAIDDPVFTEVLCRHPGRVYLESNRVPDARIREYAMSAQFCLFPSKFEMDTFLIAMGEAMACGAVPIATAQEGMAHFGHVEDPYRDPEQATGFAVRRSFAEDDPLLVDAVAGAIVRAVHLYTSDPRMYEQLSTNARKRAREFTWTACASTHLAVFSDVLAGRAAARGDNGWSVEQATERTDRQWWGEHVPGGSAAVPLSRARIDGGVLSYGMPGVQRVELVVSGDPTDLRAHPRVFELAAVGSEWRIELPPNSEAPLHVLLTMADGATRWDVLHDV